MDWGSSRGAVLQPARDEKAATIIAAESAQDFDFMHSPVEVVAIVLLPWGIVRFAESWSLRGQHHVIDEARIAKPGGDEENARTGDAALRLRRPQLQRLRMGGDSILQLQAAGLYA